MLEKLEFDVSSNKDGGTIMRVADRDDLFDITIEKTKEGSMLATKFPARALVKQKIPIFNKQFWGICEINKDFK